MSDYDNVDDEFENYIDAEFLVDWIDVTGVPQQEFFSPGPDEPIRHVCDRAKAFADELRPHCRGTVRVFDLAENPLHKAAML
jgi:hypothetical protein